MSLLATPAGSLTNLSAVPAGAQARAHRLALVPAADPWRQGFVRVLNRDARAGTVRLLALTLRAGSTTRERSPSGPGTGGSSPPTTSKRAPRTADLTMTMGAAGMRSER